MRREKAQAAQTARPKVPMRRLGADCSVVVMKRGNARGAKGAGHRHCPGSTGNGRSPMFNGRRQPSRGGTSRMIGASLPILIRLLEEMKLRVDSNPGQFALEQNNVQGSARTAWSGKRYCIDMMISLP